MTENIPQSYLTMAHLYITTSDAIVVGCTSYLESNKFSHSSHFKCAMAMQNEKYNDRASF